MQFFSDINSSELKIAALLNLLHQQTRINGGGSGMRRRQALTANEVKMWSGWEQQGRRGWTGMVEINQSSSHQASGQMLWRSLYVKGGASAFIPWL